MSGINLKLLFLFLLLLPAGCSRQTLYVSSLEKNKEITPKTYFVNYDDTFLYALHAVELQRNWKMSYFDKSAGIIEAMTPENDTITIRVSSLDQASSKVFAFVDAKNYSVDPKDRFVAVLRCYYNELNAHLEGWDERTLQ